MAKHLIDTDLYIDLIQSGGAVPIIRELYERVLTLLAAWIFDPCPARLKTRFF